MSSMWWLGPRLRINFSTPQLTLKTTAKFFTRATTRSRSFNMALWPNSSLIYSRQKSRSTSTGYSTCSSNSTLTITQPVLPTKTFIRKTPPSHSVRTTFSALSSNKLPCASKTPIHAYRLLFWWQTLAAFFTQLDPSQMGWWVAGLFLI